MLGGSPGHLEHPREGAAAPAHSRQELQGLRVKTLSSDSTTPQHSRPPTAESPSCGLGHIVPVLLTHIIHEPNCVAVPSPFGDNLSHLSSHWDRLESHVNGLVLPAASLGPSDITPCPAAAPQGEAGTAGAGRAAVAWQVTDTAQGARG